MDMASLLDSASQELEQVNTLGVGEILIARLDAID